MAQIRLYFDEDAGKHSVIKALRNAGIDVISTLEANNIQLSDEEQLSWVITQGRVIYTFNMGDFCRLHKIYMVEGREHSGIIVAAKQSYSVGEQVKGLLNLIAIQSAEDMRNQLVFLGDYIY